MNGDDKVLWLLNQKLAAHRSAVRNYWAVHSLLIFALVGTLVLLLLDLNRGSVIGVLGDAVALAVILSGIWANYSLFKPQQ